MKIFRLRFLDNKTPIPILKGIEDSFIRKGYFGGATDFYKFYAQNIKYYDVNSLYPFAMLKPMPHKLVKFHKDLTNFKLDNFFGFCLAEVNCPKNMLRPILPYKSKDNKTIFPTGKWIGVYFSEELKAVVKLGYNIQLINGYEFTKEYIFKDYVEHFYESKKNSFGAERFIAKMHLNQLYGIFGRRLDLIETINISADKLDDYLLGKVIKSVIEITDDIYAVLIHTNMRSTILEELNIHLEFERKNNFIPTVQSNVAIAAAVTSYARIHMIPFKLDSGIVYTDTDSIFTTNSLPFEEVGRELGLMKDELTGNTIKEGYFLGIKKYGYYYIDENGNTITSSVFSGIERNSLTFEDVTNIADGGVITRNVPIRFNRHIKDLNIEIKPATVTVSYN